MRKPIIAGNWKMNKTNAEAKSLVEEFIPLVAGVEDTEIVICPPATALAPVTELVKGTNIAVGAQNVHWETSGAYTGEIAPAMLTELGVKYAIIGHSERRDYFGETDENVNRRAKAAIKAGLTPIVCVGESLATREAGTYMEYVPEQVCLATQGIMAADVAKMVIAYEPIWAIGTGKTATFEQAQEVCWKIRMTIKAAFGADAAEAIRIQYGGSVKPATIKGLMEKEDVDGALVGGASLKAEDFAAIVKF